MILPPAQLLELPAMVRCWSDLGLSSSQQWGSTVDMGIYVVRAAELVYFSVYGVVQALS
jgi:hypothetical protein